MAYAAAVKMLAHVIATLSEGCTELACTAEARGCSCGMRTKHNNGGYQIPSEHWHPHDTFQMTAHRLKWLLQRSEAALLSAAEHQLSS